MSIKLALILAEPKCLYFREAWLEKYHYIKCLWLYFSIQGNNYPQLDIDDVLSIPESEREAKLKVNKPINNITFE